MQAQNSNITGLDVSACVKLDTLDLNNNKLSEMDLDANTALEILYLSYNSLSDIELSNNPNLRFIYVANNKLTELDVTQNTKLGALVISYNEGLSSPDLSKNPELFFLHMIYSPIASIDISKNAQLTQHIVYGSGLNSLDITTNHKLKSIYLNGTNFSEAANRAFIGQLINNLEAHPVAGRNLFINSSVPTDAVFLANKEKLKTTFGWGFSSSN